MSTSTHTNQPVSLHHPRPGKRAIVVGAGVGGLSAARAVSDHFDEVLVLDRDELRSGDGPRPGVPQGKHPHGLLGGGLKALEKLFPGLVQDLTQAGAVPVDPGFDFLYEIPGQGTWPRKNLRWPALALTRPLIEETLRGQLARSGKVSFQSGWRALQVLSRSDVQAAMGLLCRTVDGSRKTLESDLIIDASGSGSLTLQFLESTGRTTPRETVIGVQTRYASAFFESVRLRDDYKVVLTFPIEVLQIGSFQNELGLDPEGGNDRRTFLRLEQGVAGRLG